MLGNRRAFAATGNAKRAHAAIQVTAVNSHQLRSARDVPLGLVKFSLNKLAVVSISRLLERWKPEGRRRGFFFSVWWQVAGGHFDSGVHDYHSFDRIPQLSNISRPGI